jgi:hypothetical protein
MSEESNLMMGIALTDPDLPPIDDELYLRSICTFGGMLRWRAARAFYEQWLDEFENEPLRMAMACGIWQEAGSQLEDVLTFLIAVPEWVSRGRNTPLADLYADTQVRASGPTSVEGVAESLRKATDNDFLRMFGLPVSPNKWPAREDRDTIRTFRSKIVEFLVGSSSLRPTLNKIKHGPQLVIANVFADQQEKHPDIPDLYSIQLLFKGSRLASLDSDESPTHINLEDSGDVIKFTLDSIETTGRGLCLFAIYVYYFTFGTWPNRNARFYPPHNWFDIERSPSTKIW